MSKDSWNLNKTLRVKLFSSILPVVSLLLFILPGSGNIAAQASETAVQTQFAADDFGQWSQSSIYGQNYMGSTKLADWKQLWCSGWTDPSCLDYNQLYADLILRPCMTDTDRACLDGLEVSNSQNALEKLSFYKEATSQKIASYVFKSDIGLKSTNIPAGGGLSVWKSSESNPDGTPRYFASHVLLRYLSSCPADAPKSACSIALSDFKGSVFPVTLTPGTGCTGFALSGECVTSKNFAGNERVAMTLRMDKNLTGWIFGRMQNADFSVTPIDTDYNKIRIEGDVTLVPELSASVSKSTISQYPTLEKYLKTFFTVGRWGTGDPGVGSANWGGGTSTSYESFLKDPTTDLFAVNFDKFSLFAGFEDVLKPFSPPASNNGRNIMRSTNSIFWSFGANAYFGNNQCSADKTKLNGMVVTNATIYDKGPPEFVDGSLNYRVAGIHTNLDGSLFRGRYTYIVRSDTARCYYHFSSAPIQAKVEIVSAANVTEVASVLVSEKDGFIKLQADNFTFSSPTIKVKLTQVQPVVAAPVAPVPPATTVAPAPTVKLKKSTITCTKGKLVKKVTGTPPKCPAGYKS